MPADAAPDTAAPDTAAPETAAPDTAALHNHWWWRPGWQIGTRYYTWHLTFEHEAGLQRRVRDFQDALHGFRALDPVPIRWLHVTLVGVGHATAVDDLQVRRIVDQVRAEVADWPPIALTFRQAALHREAVMLVAEPDESLTRLTATLRRAVGDVLQNEAPTSDPRFPFVPHVTVAYANADADGRDVSHALKRMPERAVEGVSPVLSLIELHRDNRQYEWRTIATIRL